MDAVPSSEPSKQRSVVRLSDPWSGRDVLRDVTGLTRAQLEHYPRLVNDAEFRRIEANANGASPGQLLALWVERVGPVHAGAFLLRRRVGWVRAGATLGLVSGVFVLGWLLGLVAWLSQHLPPHAGEVNVIDLLRGYLHANLPELTGTVLLWLLLVALLVGPILLGLLVGAGAGWFAGGLVDAWERRRSRARVRGR